MYTTTVPGEKNVNGFQRKKILAVDDDPEMLRLLEHFLSRAGYQVYTAADGQEGLCQFRAHPPDLVILDLMMPTMNGWQTCSQIRRFSTVPIIILTALRWDEDIVRGLDCGAVDYVTKPFSPIVLLARVRAALRQATLTQATSPVIYDDGYLAVDLNECRVSVRRNPVKLSATEYRLLAYLLQNASRLLTTQQILEHVWGRAYEDETDCVRVYIWHLRQKLEQDVSNPRYLLTEHGVGYRFQKQPYSSGHLEQPQQAATALAV